jgi:hypothetical protein
MQMTSKRVIQLALALGISGFAANYVVPAASQDTGWITLFDGKNLNEWNQVGESNWHDEDGAGGICGLSLALNIKERGIA